MRGEQESEPIPPRRPRGSRDQSPATSAGQTPAEPRRGTVRSIHYTLSYAIQDPGTGPRGAIVLLHDFPGGAFVWDRVMPELAATGRAVYAFDLLGYGQSSRPWPSDTSIWGHADCLLYAFQKLGMSEMVLAGLGLGGGVAQVLATRLYREGVARLALLDSYAYDYAFARAWPVLDMATYQDPDMAHHAKLEEVLADLRTTLPTGSANPEALDTDRLAAYVDEWNSEVGKHLLFQHARLLTPIYQNSTASDLRRLEIPALIVWGELDMVTPIALGERLAREIPGARLETIPNAGHLIADDAPSAVAALLVEFAQ